MLLFIFLSTFVAAKRPRHTATNDMFSSGVFEKISDSKKRKSEWKSIVEHVDPTESAEPDIDHHDIDDELYKDKHGAKKKQEDELTSAFRRVKAKHKLRNQIKKYFAKKIKKDLKDLEEDVFTKVRMRRMKQKSTKNNGNIRATQINKNSKPFQPSVIKKTFMTQKAKPIKPAVRQSRPIKPAVRQSRPIKRPAPKKAPKKAAPKKKKFLGLF